MIPQVVVLVAADGTYSAVGLARTESALRNVLARADERHLETHVVPLESPSSFLAEEWQ
jgi:hypothetical protein